MSNFFRPLRTVNRTYGNAGAFVADNAGVIAGAPSGFRGVLSNPTTQTISGNRVIPGYNIGNNNFVSTADMNRVLRNNDSIGIRATFGNVSNPDLNALTQLRRSDNVPDARLHSSKTRADAVKTNHPATNTTTPEGVENVLNNNPRLYSYLDGLKKAGTVALIGAGAYLAFSAATLVQDVIDAINRTGGSYLVTGVDGGDELQMCLLRFRTCQLDHIRDDVTVCTNDPLIRDEAVLRNICSGFNYEVEQTVCRASDPNANVDSPQYVDISELTPDRTITCIEPYNMGDLIGDLGLDNLLGDNGILTNSSNKSKSVSDSILPAILMIGAFILIVLIGYFIFKKLGSGGGRQSFNIEPVAMQPGPTTIIQTR
ncbi:pif5 [Peridroma alphabaculovirus]|uniref:Pif5 n=1 Tax=Peridroma alphabaculovirus TaxID=1346829 RepID=A0A068LKM2_9ABAC|nr:pif5 [Peridroma alphabaculovirus]AIE47738.1 pif5 [Peridroma alphabaculovirus]